MNNINDFDLREALRRKEKRQSKMELPDDFCDNVMQRIMMPEKESQPNNRQPWLYAIRIVSSIASLWLIGLFLVLNNNTEKHNANNALENDISHYSSGSTIKNVYAGIFRPNENKTISYTKLRMMHYENK